MSKIDKLIKKLLSNSKNMTWVELTKILANFGFFEIKIGKTSGSRVKFQNKNNIPIRLHKPHNPEILKSYQINQVIETLKKEGLL